MEGDGFSLCVDIHVKEERGKDTLYREHLSLFFFFFSNFVSAVFPSNGLLCLYNMSRRAGHSSAGWSHGAPTITLSFIFIADAEAMELNCSEVPLYVSA